MPIDSDEQLAALNDSLIELRDFIKPGRDELKIAQLAEATLDGPAAPLLRSEWHTVMDDYFRTSRKPPLNTSHFRCDLLNDEQTDALYDLIRCLAQVVVITEILKYEPAAKEKLDGLIIDFIEAKRTKLISDMPKLFSAYFDITIKSHKPVWKGRTLTYRGRTVKQFRKRAPNQMCVLDKFQELDWPHEIKDPLPETAGVNPYERVNDTAKSLNKRRTSTAIEYSTNGKGTGFVWQKVES